MKTPSLVSAIISLLLPLSCGAGELRVSTSVFKTPDSVEIPGQVRVISKSEWQKTLRTLAQTKGTDLWVAPAAKTQSGKTARVNIPSTKPESGGFWRRDEEPVFPVSRIDYTPKETRGGIELVGDFQLNPGATGNKARSETVTAAKVHGVIPKGKVMTFGVGGHLFVVVVSKVRE